MNWMGQVIIQSLIAAGAAAGFVLLPWLVTKILFGVFLLWFIVSIGRNPLTYWRRLARLVVITAIPPLIMGIDFRLTGEAQLPGETGKIALAIEQTSGAALPLVILILLLALAFDLLIYWHQMRQWGHGLDSDLPDAAPLSVDRHGGITILYPLLFEAQKDPVMITGASLGILGPFPTRVDCQLYVTSDLEIINRPIAHQDPLRMPPNERRSLYVRAEVKPSLTAWWLRRATSPWVTWTGAAAGELRLVGLPRTVRTPLPLVFRRDT